jgi:hypothetical protein
MVEMGVLHLRKTVQDYISRCKYGQPRAISRRAVMHILYAVTPNSKLLQVVNLLSLCHLFNIVQFSFYLQRYWTTYLLFLCGSVMQTIVSNLYKYHISHIT